MRRFLYYLRKIAIILMGNMADAFALAMFIIPSGIITGGTPGIALTLYEVWGIPINIFVYAFNAVMFLLGLLVLGRKFAMTTVVSTIAYPTILTIMQWIVEKVGYLTTDKMLCAIFAGLLIGFGIGTVIKEGASTGGMDIPPLVLNKKLGWSVSIMIYVCDVIILLIQFPFSDKEEILYGLVMVCIYSYLMDKVLLSGKSKVRLEVVSSKYDEINSMIANQFDRGVTLYSVKGGYTKNETLAVYSVISKRELFPVKEAIKEIDPTAFMVISSVTEVSGRGFTLDKDYIEEE